MVSRARFDVANGRYRVRLQFAEISFTKAGQRVFDVYLEGARVLTRYGLELFGAPKGASLAGRILGTQE